MPLELARFPHLVRGGGYESYYARAVDPASGAAVWLRHTVHMSGRGSAPVGSLWLTVFGGEGGVVATKASTPDVSVPADGWIQIAGSILGPRGVRGEGGGARWDLRWSSRERPLQHLPSRLLYAAPLPRTKPVSPLPAVLLHGEVELGGRTLSLDGWPGMVGHNWGREHAERWIWLHGIAFAGASDTWLDLTAGRVRVAGRLSPWVVAGGLSVAGERTRIGGLRRGGRAVIDESPLALTLSCGGLRLTARSPAPQTVVWRYADPDGSEHHVANCSAAALQLDWRGRRFETGYGGAYELGMREHDHGLPVQPFADP